MPLSLTVHIRRLALWPQALDKIPPRNLSDLHLVGSPACIWKLYSASDFVTGFGLWKLPLCFTFRLQLLIDISIPLCSLKRAVEHTGWGTFLIFLRSGTDIVLEYFSTYHSKNPTFTESADRAFRYCRYDRPTYVPHPLTSLLTLFWPVVDFGAHANARRLLGILASEQPSWRRWQNV